MCDRHAAPDNQQWWCAHDVVGGGGGRKQATLLPGLSSRNPQIYPWSTCLIIIRAAVITAEDINPCAAI